MANFTLTGVNISRIPENGGHEIQVQGTFEPPIRYWVYIGATGTIADTLCYSGKPGQGTIIFPFSPTVLLCYSPLLAPGKDVFITVKDLDEGSVLSLGDPIAVDYVQFYSTVFSIRKVLPPFYKTGPRSIEQVDPVA